MNGNGTQKNRPGRRFSGAGADLCGGIFDVDGTLLDSMAVWDTAGEVFLRRSGKQPRENLTDTLKTMSLTQSAQYFRAAYGIRLSEAAIVDGINGIIGQAYRESIPLKAGAAAFVRGLSEQGIPLCVATATDRELVTAALDRLGIGGCFREIFTCHEIGHGKDEPHIYRAAGAFLGTEPAETWVFEDALHAIRTARRAGYPVAALFDAYEPDQAAVRDAATVYARDFDELSGRFV